jgi:hypothetical protein
MSDILDRRANLFGVGTTIRNAITFDSAPMTMAPSARSVVGR